MLLINLKFKIFIFIISCREVSATGIMFGFKICEYVATRRLIDRIEKIHSRFPGNHLPPKEIASILVGAINITDKSNWSSLHYSAYLGMRRTCLKLLKSGADVNKQNAWGDTPLHLSCRMRNLNCIEAILEFKPDVNIQNDMRYTPLCIFLRRPPRDEDILDKLLHAGANPDIADEYGYSPFHALAIQAATDKTKTFARLLVEYNANVNSKNAFQETPLHYAVDGGKIGLVEVLVESGASINSPNVYGQTPMDIAFVKRTRFTTLFKYLAKHLIIQYCCGFPANLAHLEEVCKTEIYRNFKKQCEEEVQLLKSICAGESTVTFFDILTSSTHTVARYLFNSNILASFLKSDIKLSIIGNLLWKRFNAGLKRYHAMNLGIVAIRKIYPSFNDLCIDNLMKYLDCDDFNNLDKAASFQT